MAFKTDAIVLRHRDLMGPDRLYDLLTPSEGKLTAVARGAQKSSSKMAGFLTTFSHVALMVGRGRQDHLAGARTIEDFRILRDSWFDFILAMSLIELVLTINVPGQAAPREFELLLGSLRRLVRTTVQRDKVAIARIFLWKILALSGWKPDMKVCERCRKPLEPESVFYRSPHGFTCREHGAEGIMVDNSLREFLGIVVSNENWEVLLRRAAQVETITLFTVSQQYYQDVIGKPLQSLNFFAYV